MAAPVGHIICAMALLHSGTVKIPDADAFYAGTSFPDIRYVADVERNATHQLKQSSLAFVKEAESSFEIGRRYHVLVDHEREKHMREHDAYRFVGKGSFSTQMLKMVEDKILFDKLKNTFNAAQIFSRIYPEEQSYGIKNQDLRAWHEILISYLDSSRWFSITRYYHAARTYREAFGLPDRLFKDPWTSVKSFAFLLYAYAKIEWLSRDEKLKAIVLEFYDDKIKRIINTTNKS